MTPLLAVEGLAVHFPGRRATPLSRPRPIRAVDGVSFAIDPGETLGLVGESGCGKSTTGGAIVQLVPATAGRILFEGVDAATRTGDGLTALRRQAQMIFQDAYAALDPRMTIEDILLEPLRIHRLGDAAARRRRIAALLDQVGLPAAFLGRYPHEMSGGQLQRVGIARALAVEPRLIVCDEPVSALDVSIQAQIVNLLEDLQAELGIALLFISHDLSVVRHLSRRIAVMYLGRIVEIAPAEDLYGDARHPYTRALLSAVPVPRPRVERDRARRRIVLEGDVPSPSDPPSGCRFRTRCPMAIADCARIDPPLRPLGGGRQVACIRVDDPPSPDGPLP